MAPHYVQRHSRTFTVSTWICDFQRCFPSGVHQKLSMIAIQTKWRNNVRCVIKSLLHDDNKSSPKSFRNSVSPFPLIQWDAAHLPPILRFSFDDHHPIYTDFLDRPQSPHQTASASNQPFCHNTLSGPTDRQIEFATIVYQQRLRSRSMDRERRANNIKID